MNHDEKIRRALVGDTVKARLLPLAQAVVDAQKTERPSLDASAVAGLREGVAAVAADFRAVYAAFAPLAACFAKGVDDGRR